MLVLSLFPGIGLLDRAFEEAGCCVVRGPDVLWGGDIHTFRPPAGRFDGVIGGPPCQRFSRLANVVRAVHGEDALAPDLIPEFARCVREARPDWFLMENVPAAPIPAAAEYAMRSVLFNNRWVGGTQNRVRRFTLGIDCREADGGCSACLELLDTFEDSVRAQDKGLDPALFEPAVCSSAGGRRASARLGGDGRRKQACLLRARTVAEEATLQGLPTDFLAGAPFTVEGKRQAISNGVPLPLGRAVARAVLATVSAARAEVAA